MTADRLYATLQGLVGGRCYRLALPQGWVLPAITFRQTEGVQEYTLSGSAGLSRERWQVVCWHESPALAAALADEAQAAVEGWPLAYGVPAICVGRVEGLDAETGLYQVAIDIVTWQRPA